MASFIGDIQLQPPIMPSLISQPYSAVFSQIEYPNLMISVLSRTLPRLEMHQVLAGEDSHGRWTGSPTILLAVTGA
jgi:hypothetical protein